jgi:hypothetical protein
MPANKKEVQTEQYQGEPADTELENGPLAKRSCTDPLCCLLFVAFVCGMIGVGAYGISKGNPTIIGRGYDSDGKICGIDDGYTDYKFLYWPVPKSGFLTNTVCVKACPVSGATSVDCKFNSDYVSLGTNSCNNPTCTNNAACLIFYNSAAATNFFIYDTKAFIGRFCLPTDAVATFQSASNTVMNSEVLEQWVSDIRETWKVIACSMGLAFVVGIFYMLLMRYCSGVLTWLAIFCFIGGMAALGWRFYVHAQATTDETAGTATDTSSDTSSNSQKSITSEKVLAYLCWAIAGLTFLAVLCLYSRIRLAIAIMKAAADYVKETPSACLLPPVTIIFLITFYLFWGVAAVYLVSSGDASQIQGSPFGSFEFDKTLQRLLIYHLFGLLWLNAFIIASCQFVIASSTCLWYFSQGTGQGVTKTIRTSLHRLFRYHLGSIAFGSLIIAIIQMIRIMLSYMQYQAKKMAGKEGRIVRYVLTCLQCYVACFERFIQFLNKNAYIQIALTGKSFCPAAKDAFFLILRNPVRFGLVAGIGGIFVFFGKVFVASITALTGFLVITKWDKFSTSLYSPFVPTIVMFIFAYVIGAIFMTVYGLAADTILACFVTDEELSKKKNAPARHCPASLRDFIDSNKKH